MEVMFDMANNQHSGMKDNTISHIAADTQLEN